MTARAVVCVNLMDEARRRGIRVDIAALEEALGVPVVGCAARDGAGVERLLRRVRAVAEGRETPKPREVRLAPDIEYGRDRIAPRSKRVLSPSTRALPPCACWKTTAAWRRDWRNNSACRFCACARVREGNGSARPCPRARGKRGGDLRARGANLRGL